MSTILYNILQTSRRTFFKEYGISFKISHAETSSIITIELTRKMPVRDWYILHTLPRRF